MKSYRVLALDMDGTLLDSRKHVLPQTAQALAQLAKSGIAVALSTGRGVAELVDYLPDLPFIQYGSLVSGCVTMDLQRRRAIQKHPLPTATALSILDVAREARAMPQLLTTTASVTTENNIQHMPEYHMGVYQEMYERVCTRTNDFEGYVQSHEGTILKINLYHHTPEEREKTLARLQGKTIGGVQLTLARAETTSLECTIQGVTKTTGIAAVCDLLGCTLNDVVAIGDAPNDLDMLRSAGCSVAMGNATQEIKAAANLVVSDNDHNGIVDAIQQLF